MRHKRASTLIKRTIETIESSARMPWIDSRSTKCPVVIDSWSTAVSAATTSSVDEYEWPFSVTRRAPVIVWNNDGRLRCLVKTRRIWQARNACVPSMPGVTLDNETWMHKQITDVSVQLFEWMRALFCGRPTKLRVKQMVDWSALSS